MPDISNPDATPSASTPSGRIPPIWRHVVAILCMASGTLLLFVLALLYRFDDLPTRLYDLAACAGALGGYVDFSWRTLGREETIERLTWAEFWNGYARIISGAIVGVVLWGLTKGGQTLTENGELLIGIAGLCGVLTPVVFNQLFAQIGGMRKTE